MIAALRQNALPIAMILVCAAALYLVYRDMKKIDARLNRLDAAVLVLAEEQHTGGTCPVHDAAEAFDEYEAALLAEEDEPAEGDEPAEEDELVEGVELPDIAEEEHDADPVAEPAPVPAAEPMPAMQA